VIWRIYTPLGQPRERANGDIQLTLRPTEDVELPDGDLAIDYARQKYGPGIVVRGMVPRDPDDPDTPLNSFEILKLTDGGWVRAAMLSAPSKAVAESIASSLFPRDVVSVQESR
jgi:hypothetical protein